MSWQTLYQDLDADTLLRIGFTLAAGLVLGAEREIHGRAAGLRTTVLVALSSCVVMLVSNVYYEETFQPGYTGWRPDPARLAAGILAGMGFLGAGVILHQRTHIIRGVTTAATIWLASIIGIAMGAGLFGTGMVATAISAILLGIVPKFEDRLKSDWYSDLTLRLDPDSATFEELTAAIRSYGVEIKGVDWQEDIAARQRTLLFQLKYKKGDNLALTSRVIGGLSKLPGVKAVRWHA